MIQYLQDNFWFLLVVCGIVTGVFLFLIFSILPRIVRQLPETYFVDDQLELEKKNLVQFVGRNFLGMLLLIAGPIVMLPLITLPPGSGLMVMVLGVGLMDYPGKRRHLRKLLRSSKVRRLLNWMRISGGIRPFVMPNDLESDQPPADPSGS